MLNTISADEYEYSSKSTALGKKCNQSHGPVKYRTGANGCQIGLNAPHQHSHFFDYFIL